MVHRSFFSIAPNVPQIKNRATLRAVALILTTTASMFFICCYKSLKPVIQWRFACDIELIRMELEETKIGKFLTGFIVYND